MDKITISDKKIWRVFIGEFCPVCDSPIIIKTERTLDDGYAYEGDKTSCLKCGNAGEFRINGHLGFNCVEWENKDSGFWKDYFKSPEFKVSLFISLIGAVLVLIIELF